MGMGRRGQQRAPRRTQVSVTRWAWVPARGVLRPGAQEELRSVARRFRSAGPTRTGSAAPYARLSHRCTWSAWAQPCSAVRCASRSCSRWWTPGRRRIGPRPQRCWPGILPSVMASVLSSLALRRSGRVGSVGPCGGCRGSRHQAMPIRSTCSSVCDPSNHRHRARYMRQNKELCHRQSVSDHIGRIGDKRSQASGTACPPATGIMSPLRWSSLTYGKGQKWSLIRHFACSAVIGTLHWFSVNRVLSTATLRREMG